MPEMPAIASGILSLADTIPGYSRAQLLADLEPLITPQKFYSVEELAVRYGVTTNTIRNWEGAEMLKPDLQVGKNCVRYSASNLAEFELKYRERKGSKAGTPDKC